MAITNVYKLFKDGKRFKKESKKLMRSEIALPRAFVEEKNAKWEQNGLWHEIDEDATTKYIAWGEKKRAKKAAEVEAQEKLKNVLTDVLTTGSKVLKKEKTAKKQTKPDDESVKILKALRIQYKEVIGKRVPPRQINNAEWIEETIKNHKK